MSDLKPSPITVMNSLNTRCPVCKYSMNGLADDQPCPECGIVVMRGLMICPEMQDAAYSMKFWCILGCLGWVVIAFAHWAHFMIIILIMNGYYPGSFGIYDIAGVWFRTAFVIAPLALGISWFKHSRRVLYQRAMKTESSIPKTPKRVVFVMLPGMLLGVGIVLLLLFALLG